MSFIKQGLTKRDLCIILSYMCIDLNYEILLLIDTLQTGETIIHNANEFEI